MTRGEIREQRKTINDLKTPQKQQIKTADTLPPSKEENSQEETHEDTQEEKKTSKKTGEKCPGTSSEEDYLHFFKDEDPLRCSFEEDFKIKRVVPEDEKNMFKLRIERFIYGCYSPSFKEDLMDWRPQMNNCFQIRLQPMNNNIDEYEEELISDCESESLLSRHESQQAASKVVKEEKEDANLRINVAPKNWRKLSYAKNFRNLKTGTSLPFLKNGVKASYSVFNGVNVSQNLFCEK